MDDDQKREPPISYRPPKGQRAELEARVMRSGLSTNAFITAALLGDIVPRPRRLPALHQITAAQLLVQAARIHDRLVGLRLGAAPDDAALIRDALRELSEIRTLLMQALDRSP